MDLQTFDGLRSYFIPNLAEGQPGARPQADALKDLLGHVRRGLTPVACLRQYNQIHAVG